jgi:hypothetical protein
MISGFPFEAANVDEGRAKPRATDRIIREI